MASTSCTVIITPPNGTPVSFTTGTAQIDLMAVSTQKDLSHATGQFTLTLAPIEDREGRTWADRIPLRSLVRIEMERIDPLNPDTTTVNPTVMLGLVEQAHVQEDYRAAQIRRSVVVSGREVSGIMLDAILWFNPQLSRDPSNETVSFLVRLLGDRALSLMWDATLLRGAEDPKDAIKRILDFFLFSPGAGSRAGQKPVINLQFADRDLSDILKINDETWTLFEPVLTPHAAMPEDVGSVWNFLSLFVDTTFQEFFTRVEDGVSKIFFRAKPFLTTPVTQGTRFQSSEAVPTLQTFFVTKGILARQVQRSSAHVYNTFFVMPRTSAAFPSINTFLNAITPEIIKEADHPSCIYKYGMRVLRVSSPYLASYPTQSTQSQQAMPPQTPAVAATAPAATVAPPPSPTGNKPSAAKKPMVDLANQVALKEGVSPDHIPHFVGLIQAESGFNPAAESAAGAKGLAQLTPQSGFLPPNPFDPVASLTGGARYWIQLAAQFHGQTDLIVAAYNAGPSRVINAGYKVPNIKETQQHVRNVNKYAPQYKGLVRTVAPAQPPPTPPAPPVQAAAPVATTPAPAARPAPQVDVQSIASTAQRWAKILRAWYDHGGELLAGTIILEGHPRYNIGHRLVVQSRQGLIEYYIEGVAHQYDYHTGMFLTHLRVTRGWPINGLDAQLQEAGMLPIDTV